MSKLKQLLKEKCPNGVEYVKIGDVCTITKGKTPIQKAIPGKYPLVVTTSERKSCNTYQFDKSAVCIPLVSSRGHGVASLNHVYFQSGKFALGNILCAVIPNDEKTLSANYLYHYLEYKKDTLLVPLMKGGANVSLHIDDIQRVKIPLPPIEVQSKIIEILDKFVELSDVLSKELSARQNQYKYYRDLLLDFGVHGGGTSECEWRTLGEVCFCQSGGTPSTKTPEYWGGDIKWLASTVCNNTKTVKEVTKYITEAGAKKSRIMKPKTTLIALVGATIGKTAFLPYEAAINQNIVGIYPIDEKNLMPDFVYYYCSRYYDKFMELSSGKLAMANMSFVRGLLFPIIPIEKQKRIVSILDRFDKLCNDISEGLPAEIEARRKQYEYYRDKLLSFEEVKA